MLEGKPLVVVVGGSNTGRTPMVAALLKAAVAGAAVVETAGVLAHAGEPAVPEARMALEQLGVTLGDHHAQSLTPEQRHHADLLLAVDRGTALVLQRERPHDTRICCLSALCDQQDVLDPHRMPLGVWLITAKQLQAQVEHVAPMLRERLGVVETASAIVPVPAPPAAAPSNDDPIAHMSRLLLTAETLPMIVDWGRVCQELVQHVRLLATECGDPLDLLPAAVLMIEGVLTHHPTQPPADVLQRMRQAIECFNEPIDANKLAQIGVLLQQR